MQYRVIIDKSHNEQLIEHFQKTHNVNIQYCKEYGVTFVSDEDKVLFELLFNEWHEPFIDFGFNANIDIVCLGKNVAHACINQRLISIPWEIFLDSNQDSKLPMLNRTWN